MGANPSWDSIIPKDTFRRSPLLGAIPTRAASLARLRRSQPSFMAWYMAPRVGAMVSRTGETAKRWIGEHPEKSWEMTVKWLSKCVPPRSLNRWFIEVVDTGVNILRWWIYIYVDIWSDIGSLKPTLYLWWNQDNMTANHYRLDGCPILDKLMRWHWQHQNHMKR